MMDKKSLPLLIGSIVVVVAAVALVFLARGTSYTLTVTDPVLGNPEAPIVIEEFSDFQCPACKAAVAAVKEILRQYPTQVQVVYRDFPIAGHQHARLMAAGGLCAAQQGKFSAFYEKIFDKQNEWAAQTSSQAAATLRGIAQEEGMNLDDFDACRTSYTVKKEVSADYKEGLDRTVTSTPTFFVDGEKKEGALTVFQFIQLINAALEKRGLTPEQPQPAETPAVSN